MPVEYETNSIPLKLILLSGKYEDKEIYKFKCAYFDGTL